jgi:hypothetical protein
VPTQTPPTDSSTASTRPERENVVLSLACNIVLPGLVLSNLSSPDRLGPVGALLLGISIPLAYGLRDLVVRRTWNFFAIVGLLSVSLTGTFALLELDGFWFAVKEASVPTMFGLAIVATIGSGKPLVRQFILNEAVVDVARLDEGLEAHGSRVEFDGLLRRATWWMSGSFALSAVLNFVLARVLLISPPGTPEFTAELGRMTWLSWPVIALPSTVLTMFILWRLLAGIQELTGLSAEDLLHTAEKPDPDRSSTL